MIMALKLRRRLSESGRSLVLRVPKDVERLLGWKAGDDVMIFTRDGEMIVKKAE